MDRVSIVDEEWRSVIGWPDYEVSNFGHIRSLDRRVPHLGSTRLSKGRILKGSRSTSGRRHVTLCRDGIETSVYAYRLVLENFVRPPLPDEEGRHWDDDPTNDRLDNLLWGTSSQNKHDAVRNGHHYWAKRDSCINGHKYPVDCPIVQGGRKCVECEKVNGRNYRLRKGKRVKSSQV